MISVIIPVLDNRFYTKNLLVDIRNNIVKPKEIFIIDDGSTEDIISLRDEFQDLNIIYIRHKHTKGVNFSWNEGIKLSSGKYVSILNNDININIYFFKKIIESFQSSYNIGIVCPTTVSNEKKILDSKDELVNLIKMKKREGWAFTLRKTVLEQLSPIPSFLITYCGDDYLFYYTSKAGYFYVKMSNNYIYHHGSITLNTIPSVWGERGKEKIKWEKYLLTH
jgi:glycosyltransferase involved in cell wall biosynthesis